MIQFARSVHALRFCVAFIVGVLCLSVGRSASAASFSPGCDNGVGDAVALTSALSTAQSNAEDDDITLVAGCTYTVTTVNDTSIGAVGLPPITAGVVTLHGSGATIARDPGAAFFRLFLVNGGTLTADHLTLANGSTDPASSFTDGGAIRVQSGTLNLSSSTVLASQAATGASGFGGGVAVKSGAFGNVTTCTFSQNLSALGGGLYNEGGTLVVANTTITGNHSIGSGGGVAQSAGTTTLINVTVANNLADGDGGGLVNQGGTVDVHNSLVATNTDSSSGNSPDVAGVFTDDGNNLIGASDGSTGFTVSTLVGTVAALQAADLGALANNGGSTQTIALAPTSAAINAADSATCQAAPVGGVDQRGVARVVGDCDIGAFELASGLALTLQSTVNPSVFGQSITLTGTASVSPAGPPLPTTAFTINEGSSVLTTGTLTAGQLVFMTSALAVGSHSLTFNFAGDGTFAAASSSVLVQVVDKGATTTTLVASASPAVTGQPVVLTATVAATAPAAGGPIGVVTFKDGTTVLGTAGVASGVAALSVPSFTVGTHSLTAEYAGDASFDASTSSALSLTVKAAGITGTLTSSKNPSNVAENVTFTAKFFATDSSVVPTGSVQFMDGTTSLGTSTLASGTATIDASTLGAGAHTIQAVYGGDSDGGSGATTLSMVQIVQGALGGNPPDAGSVTGGNDAGSSSSDTNSTLDGGGCGCRSTSAPSGGAGAATLFAALALIFVRRRRRA